jgi:hypothetical protein
LVKHLGFPTIQIQSPLLCDGLAVGWSPVQGVLPALYKNNFRMKNIWLKAKAKVIVVIEIDEEIISIYKARN